MLAIINVVRGRPENTKKYCDDWKIKNAGMSEVLFVFDQDDPKFEEQIEASKGFRNIIAKYTGRGVCARIQEGYEAIKDPKFTLYHSTADDITHSQDFDKQMLEELEHCSAKAGHRLWVMYGDDCVHGQKLCTHWFASKEYIETVGYFTPSGYMSHCYTDNTFFTTGFMCGILRYVPWVKTHHHSWANGEAEKDANYNNIYNDKAMTEDRIGYECWTREQLPISIKKITEKIPEIKS